MEGCTLCPRMCGADRASGQVGFCGQTSELRIARAALHPFEEPPVSGTRGSGTVFFCGCSLRCVFCQNQKISRSDQTGRTVTSRELGEIFLDLQSQGAHNINLVTPTHFADGIIEALTAVKDRLTIPVLYNSSGYERVETLRRLDGLIDIYMPDFKYVSPELAEQYSSAPDYAEVASKALREMLRQAGHYRLDENGLLQKGLLVRHLILPGARKDSIAVFDRLAAILPPSDVLVSVMSQYTPEFALATPFTNLHRTVTTFEYRSVVEYATSLGFDGFMQSKSSASSRYTPDF